VLFFLEVRCDGTVETVNFVAVTQTLGPPSLNIQPNTFKAISLEVVPSSNDPEPDLPIFKVNRPCYMASSLDMELDEEEGDALSHVTMTIAQGAFHMNGVLYSADNIFEDVQAGGLIEMEVEGLAGAKNQMSLLLNLATPQTRFTCRASVPSAHQSFSALLNSRGPVRFF